MNKKTFNTARIQSYKIKMYTTNTHDSPVNECIVEQMEYASLELQDFIKNS